MVIPGTMVRHGAATHPRVRRTGFGWVAAAAWLVAQRSARTAALVVQQAPPPRRAVQSHPRWRQPPPPSLRLSACSEHVSVYDGVFCEATAAALDHHLASGDAGHDHRLFVRGAPTSPLERR